MRARFLGLRIPTRLVVVFSFPSNVLKEILDRAVTLSQTSAICYAFPARDYLAPASRKPLRYACLSIRPPKEAPARGELSENWGPGINHSAPYLRRPGSWQSALEMAPEAAGAERKGTTSPCL